MMPSMSAPRRLSRRRLVAFSAFVLLLFGLGTVELFYRAAQGWIDDQGWQLRQQGFDPNAPIKLLFLGDSFTAGELSEAGVGFWHYVPAAFRARGETRRVQVINLALAGSTTRFHRDQLVRFLEEHAVAPDAVMLITGANNASAQASLQAFLQAPESRGHAPAAMRFWYRFPRVVYGLNAVAFLIGRYRLGVDDEGKLGMAGDWNPVDTGRWTFMADGRFCWVCPDATSRLMALRGSPYAAWLDGEIRGMVGEVDDAVRARGGRLLTGTYVGQNHVVTDPPIDPLGDEARARGLPMLDLSDPAVIARFRQQGFFIEDGWHLSDAGSKALATAWAEWYLRLEAAGFPGGTTPAADVGL
jgi:lysophospholipase L1-like esterase